MSQIEFTSACAGDIGVTLMGEVVCIAFIHMSPVGVDHVNVNDIRKGGYHAEHPNLASALQAMLCMADNYRTADLEKEVEDYIKAKKAFGKALWEGTLTQEWAEANPRLPAVRED